MTPAVFAVGRGQYENIGDIVLRRQLLDWVRPPGGLHVYVGDSPPGYDEGLRLHPDDTVYRSFTGWYRAALAAAFTRGASSVFKPGEIQLTLVGMKEHLAMLPLLLAIRATGGRAVRVGVGARNFAPVPRALMGPSIALSDLTLWRDDRTAEYMRAGSAMPDLAFGEGADDDAVVSFESPDPRRDKLVVSMRSDEDVHPCPYPSAAWIDGIRTFADRHGLEIWAVTQVQVDDERTRRLAVDLGGRALTWDEGRGHDEQETLLRALYRTTEMALSDRLHVIVAAYTEGAIPVGSLVEVTDKIDRHFRTIGVEGTSISTGSMTAERITAALEEFTARRPVLFQRLIEARVRLRRHRDDVRRVLRLAPAPAVDGSSTAADGPSIGAGDRVPAVGGA